MTLQRTLPLKDPAGTAAAAVLVAAVLFFDLVALAVDDEFPGVGARIALGIVLGLVTLASAWLALGREYLLIRLVVALAAVALLAGPPAKVTRPGWAEWFGVLLVFTTVVALLLRFGHWLVRGVNSAEEARAARRYTVGTLLVLITAACLLLAAGRLATFPWQHAGPVLGYLAGFAVISVASTAVSLARRVALAAALPVLIILCPLVGLVLGHIESSGGFVEPFTMILVVQAITIWLGLAVRVLIVQPEAEADSPFETPPRATTAEDAQPFAEKAGVKPAPQSEPEGDEAGEQEED